MWGAVTAWREQGDKATVQLPGNLHNNLRNWAGRPGNHQWWEEQGRHVWRIVQGLLDLDDTPRYSPVIAWTGARAELREGQLAKLAQLEREALPGPGGAGGHSEAAALILAAAYEPKMKLPEWEPGQLHAWLAERAAISGRANPEIEEARAELAGVIQRLVEWGTSRSEGSWAADALKLADEWRGDIAGVIRGEIDLAAGEQATVAEARVRLIDGLVGRVHAVITDEGGTHRTPQ